MSSAIQKTEPMALATVRVQAMRTALDEESAIRKMIAEYVREHMVPDVDYGVIPGTAKPSLLKPGAQKLISLFRCAPTYKLIRCTEDFAGGLFSFMFRVRLVSRDTKEILAEGYGAANSREGRYRWRDAARKCPSCTKETIIKGKAEYGGGWICFTKKGGCGAKFRDGDQTIEGQPLGKTENDDIATLANTVLKMAKKRAEVDGAIALAHCADMFTQDLEDIEAIVVEGQRETPRQESPRVATSQPAAPASPSFSRADSVKAKLAGRAANRSNLGNAPAVDPAQETGEEIVTPTMAFARLARDSGLTMGQLTLRAMSLVGKTTGFSHDDIAKLRTSLVAVPNK